MKHKHEHRKLYPYLKVQHERQGHEQPELDLGSAMISRPVLFNPLIMHVAVADMDATYGTEDAAENGTFNKAKNNNEYAKNKNNHANHLNWKYGRLVCFWRRHVVRQQNKV